MKETNDTMMQYFEWYLPNDCNLWNEASKIGPTLKKLGINSIWLPPCFKSAGGINDTGYGIYDLYDMGEFDQKGTIRTKYGTKDEYLNTIKSLQKYNIKVLADVVLNHRLGADEKQDIFACRVNPNNRIEATEDYKTISAWTKFDFAGRNNTYSDFKLNWSHFSGIDYDAKTDENAIYRFYGKHWSDDVDKELGNFDYLMGCDVDFNNLDVVDNLFSWGQWFIDQTNVDGFRLDAIKHIRSSFYKRWLHDLKNYIKRPIYTVGEYFSVHTDALTNYLDKNDEIDALFDVPLHDNFKIASESSGNYDMSKIFDNTLVNSRPSNAVTFVDNHDTEPGQSLESWVKDWFKPLAYAMILLRESGTPCVFFGDYYGIPFLNISPLKDFLNILLLARKFLAYGEQIDYLDDPNIIGWVRMGDYYHQDSGMAVILSDAEGGSKQMNVGKNLANSILYDCTGNIKETVYVDNDGNGIFYVNGGSVSVWIKKDNMYNL